MNNRGFTLAELLITLGVVGVISALLGTALVNMQPDQDKIRYLKRFDSIKTSVNDLARNSRLFPVCQDNLSCKDHPLFNTAAGVSGRYTAIGDGDEKFCVGLSMMLNGRNLPNLNCTNQPIEYKDGADWTPSFETQNGTQWLVSTLRTLSGTSAVYQSDIYFDINGVDGPNCLYDSESCPVPDRFKVMVAANGTVIAADPVGQYYLTTRKNFKKRDLEIAENASVTENLNANLRNFTLTPCALEVASADSPVTPPAGGGNGSAVNPGGGSGNNGGNNSNNGNNPQYKCGDEYNGKIINCYEVYETKYKLIDGNYFSYAVVALQFPAASNIVWDYIILDAASNKFRYWPIYLTTQHERDLQVGRIINTINKGQVKSSLTDLTIYGINDGSSMQELYNKFYTSYYNSIAQFGTDDLSQLDLIYIEKTWNEYQNFIISLKNNQGGYINYSKGKKTFYRCEDKQYIYIENAELNEIQNVSPFCNSLEN